MQKFLTLLITAAILYMIVQHKTDSWETPKPQSSDNNTENSSDDEEIIELQGSFIEKTLSKVVINTLKTDEGKDFIEKLITPMDQPIAGSEQGYIINNNDMLNSLLSIKTFNEEEGQEGPASCGHMVKVRYKMLTANNILVQEKIDSFPLGTGKSVPGIDAVVVGMKTGQTRHAKIPIKYFNPDEKNSSKVYKLHVDLLEIMPKNFVGDDVKLYDDQIAYHIPLICGQKVAFDAKITKLSNSKVIYDSTKSGKKIVTTIGNLVDPVIVSHALHNKVPVGTRTVIAKGRLFKSQASNNSRFFPDKVLPANEYFMLDLMNFDNLSIKHPKPQGGVIPRINTAP